jgi:hypothetical protein
MKACCSVVDQTKSIQERIPAGLSLSGRWLLLLLLKLNMRRWPEGGGGVWGDAWGIFADTLLLSLSTVFSTALEIRLTRLGVVGSLWSSERERARGMPRVWGLVSISGAVEGLWKWAIAAQKPRTSHLRLRPLRLPAYLSNLLSQHTSRTTFLSRVA